jgi:hypothetical protein
VDTPIPPRRVLGRHPQDQAPQLRWNRRPTGRAVWHGPVASDQLAMPAQQGLRCHEPMVSTLGGEQSGQRREHGAVWPGGAWAGDLTAQDRDLMSEYEDFGVLGRLLAGQQREPAEELAEDDVEESQRHDWRSSRTSSPCCEAVGQPSRRRSRHPQDQPVHRRSHGTTVGLEVLALTNTSSSGRAGPLVIGRGISRSAHSRSYCQQVGHRAVAEQGREGRQGTGGKAPIPGR